jgi:microcystin degradation protein MlrC
MTYRAAAAQISHETNVFSSVTTDIAAFEAAGIARGAEIVRVSKETNSSFGGFIRGAARHSFELLPMLSLWATPSGLVRAEAISSVLGELVQSIEELQRAPGIDGVLLALHGAMVTEVDRDGDAYILEQVRKTVGSNIPIVATLDLHANISQRMIDAADLLIGYDTYPHVDIAERAEEACGLLKLLIVGSIRPTGALVKPPMLPTSQRMTTDIPPMRDLIRKAHQLEADPAVLTVTVAGGFPPADVEEAGLGALVYTDGAPALANRLARELALLAWDCRKGFLGGVSSWEEAADAIGTSSSGKPIIIVDIGDNPWTGGPGDSAELLRFLTGQEASSAALALIADPESVNRCISAGVGGSVDLALGGKTDALHGPRLPVAAQVRMISDGTYVNAGPMMKGVAVNLGPTALISVYGIDVLVTSRAETPIDLNIFRVHGIEPMECSIIALKGKGHFRAAFEPIASQVILVEGPGITGADLSRLSFAHVRRPIWPLDPDLEWPESRQQVTAFTS